jgi:hypothetical protein
MRSEYVGEQLVFAVAQRSFETSGNCFSTLRPVSTLECEPVDPREFRNRGLAWWMVKGLEFQTAAPGRLIIATVEESKEADPTDPEKDAFQVSIPTVKWAAPKSVIEVLTLPRKWSDPLSILSDAVVMCDHQPTLLVLVRMEDMLYGPFRTDAKAASSSEGLFEVRFLKQLGERPIYRLGASGLRTSKLTAEVTDEARAPSRADRRKTCRYELASWSDFESASDGAQTIDLVTDEEIVRRVARRLLTKAQANDVVARLREIQAGLAGDGPDEDHERIAAIIERLTAEVSALDELADAIAGSQRFKPRLEAAISRKVDEAILSRASTIRAQAETELSHLRGDLERAQTDLETVRQDLEAERRRGLSLLKEELSATRTQVEAEMAENQAAAQERLERLRSEHATIEASLTSATARLKDERQRAIEDFLVLQPLIEAFGSSAGQIPEASQLQPPEVPPIRQEIILPAILAGEGAERRAIEEEEFFERLVRHVEACGFQYRRLDLASFHVATKVSDFTILGGLSGTGKSSLPVLYSQALAGEEAGVFAERFLAVDVSPSWTSPNDVLGHVNLLDHTFSPSASGLFARLAQAALEAESKGLASGLHLICLEEMNLAQVEHYFSAFIQALSRDPSRREVSVFDPSALSRDDPLRRWTKLPLRENVRFCGTVNFDETTRRISQRVLDRSDLIQLRSEYLTDADRVATASGVSGNGPSIRVSDLKAWSVYRPLSQQAATLFEAMQPALAALGCPLTPRRQSAIAGFLASAEKVCTSTEALDMQIMQRVLPQIRSVFRPGAKQALEALEGAIATHAGDCEEARTEIGNLIKSEEATLPDWDFE